MNQKVARNRSRDIFPFWDYPEEKMKIYSGLSPLVSDLRNDSASDEPKFYAVWCGLCGEVVRLSVEVRGSGSRTSTSFTGMHQQPEAPKVLCAELRGFSRLFPWFFDRTYRDGSVTTPDHLMIHGR